MRTQRKGQPFLLLRVPCIPPVHSICEDEDRRPRQLASPRGVSLGVQVVPAAQGQHQAFARRCLHELLVHLPLLHKTCQVIHLYLVRQVMVPSLTGLASPLCHSILVRGEVEGERRHCYLHRLVGLKRLTGHYRDH